MTEATETANSVADWFQTWGYDRYGNRTSFAQNIGGNPASNNPSIDANTNRYNANQGFTFDKNGNIITDVSTDNFTRNFVFNGDNKQTEVKKNGITVGRYFYDGEGKRVKKVSDLETTIFVYSSGKLVAEYSTATPPATPTVNYTTTDHLGSPRVITDAIGQVTSRRDFLPFGEEVTINVGARSTALKYGSSDDKVRQKFTGYQKDTETSLDFAEARMYDNRFGRFTAVDPLLASGKSGNPQTFNRFVYVGNNPIHITDPTGLDWGYKAVSPGENKPFEYYYKWFDGKMEDGYSAVPFGDSDYFWEVPNWWQDDKKGGTRYLDRFSNNVLNKGQFDAAMASFNSFMPGGECYANPKCSGFRNPTNDGLSRFAAREGMYGYPQGLANRAMHMFDLPSWNLAPPPIDMFKTDSLASRGLVDSWINYYQTSGPYQQAGASAGGLTFDVVTAIATKRIGGSLSRPYTQSYAGLGLEMHKQYKVAEQIEGLAIKEYRLPSGRRIDFLDIPNRTIFELKPYNPRGMNMGHKQLQRYKEELQTIPQFSGFKWKTVLDTY